MQSSEYLIVRFLPTNSLAENRATSPRLSFRKCSHKKFKLVQKYFVVWKKNADVINNSVYLSYHL